MKYLNPIFMVIATLVSSIAYSERCKEDNITIDMIRAVGDYTHPTHESTLEIWFASRSWCDFSDCTNKHRVVVDPKHSHIVSAAYMAFAAGKEVHITVDNAFPARSGICEITHIDIVK